MGAIVQASLLNPLDRSTQIKQIHNSDIFPGSIGLGVGKQWVGFLLGNNGGLGHRTSEYDGSAWSDVNTVYSSCWYDPLSTGIGANYQIRIVASSGAFVDREGAASTAWSSMSGTEPTVLKVPQGGLWYVYIRRIGGIAGAVKLNLWAPSS